MAAIGITIAALDRVTPDPSALAREGMAVRYSHIEARLERLNRSIPAEVRYQPTANIRPGARQVVQSPEPGALEITEKVWYKDGVATKREFVSQRVATFPKHEIIALGTRINILPEQIAPHRRYALAYRGGSPRDRANALNLPPANPGIFQPVRCLMVTATGYAAGRAGGAIGSRTCTGVRCTYGAVAVDPGVIPLGSKMYIEGYGYGFACDTGGAIRGRHIDLAFDSAHAAFAHGRKSMKVWILGPG